MMWRITSLVMQFSMALYCESLAFNMKMKMQMVFSPSVILSYSYLATLSILDNNCYLIILHKIMLSDDFFGFFLRSFLCVNRGSISRTIAQLRMFRTDIKVMDECSNCL